MAKKRYDQYGEIPRGWIETPFMRLERSATKMLTDHPEIIKHLQRQKRLEKLKVLKNAYWERKRREKLLLLGINPDAPEDEDMMKDSV